MSRCVSFHTLPASTEHSVAEQGTDYRRLALTTLYGASISSARNPSRQPDMCFVNPLLLSEMSATLQRP